MIGRLRYVLRMAWADLRHDWAVSAAICLAITAVAAPLLVLAGLYQGVVGQIFADLRADPAARAIRLQASGAAQFDVAWFDQVRAWPEVAFVVPATRWAAAQGQLIGPGEAAEARASILPTGDGDPVFDNATSALTAPGEAKLSASLAEAVGATVGDRATLLITRKGQGGREESVAATLTITEVAEPARFGRDAVFVSLSLLVAVENYKDGLRAPELGADGPAAPQRAAFRDFRLYARDVGDVAPLLARLIAEPHRLTVRGETGRIDFALGLDRSFRLVVGAVGVLGVLGLAGGLAAIQWSMAARRRRIIAVFGLIGFDRVALVAFPVVQAVTLGLAGGVLTVLAAYGFAGLINAGLGARLSLPDGAAACDISAAVATGMIGLIVIISAVPAAEIGRRFARLEPADEIRET